MASFQAATLNNTVGALVLGLVGSTFLFGITTLQMFLYYHRFQKDSLLHKCAVALLWALDAFHLALTIHAVYTYVVPGFGKVDNLQHILWSVKTQVSINVIVVVLVQALYAYRVWILGGYHRGFLGYLVFAVVLGGFAVGITLAHHIFTIDTYSQLDKISWVINASLATSTSIDFMISFAMCFYLRKSKGSLTSLNSSISQMIQYTLSCGLFTSACSLSAMFTYILLPDTFIYLAVQFILTKFYVGSFFAMLNARKRPTKPRDEENSSDTQIRVRFETMTLHAHSPRLAPPSPSLHLQPQETDTTSKVVHQW